MSSLNSPLYQHSSPQNIILCGFMGSGKTTVGQVVAAKLTWKFVDTDHLIESRYGKSIKAIFAEEGEDTFRALERDLCVEIGAWEKHVVATGGGIVVNPANRDALIRAGMVVCLDTTPEDIMARLAHSTTRPLLQGPNPKARIRELFEARRDAYAALPFHIDTSHRHPVDVADSVVKLFREQLKLSKLEPKG